MKLKFRVVTSDCSVLFSRREAKDVPVNVIVTERVMSGMREKVDKESRGKLIV